MAEKKLSTAEEAPTSSDQVETGNQGTAIKEDQDKPELSEGNGSTDNSQQGPVKENSVNENGPTLGELLVNPAFNPGQNGYVAELKKRYAYLIDLVDKIPVAAGHEKQAWAAKWKEQTIDGLVILK